MCELARDEIVLRFRNFQEAEWRAAIVQFGGEASPISAFNLSEPTATCVTKRTIPSWVMVLSPWGNQLSPCQKTAKNKTKVFRVLSHFSMAKSG